MAKNQMLAESRAATLRTARRSELIFSALSETLPGTVLDEKYRLAEKIGSGNFGTVYRGEHIFLHHPVAVKVFRPAIGHVALESLERFRLEGISACRINHPNAVTVLDFDVSAGSLAYLVMELLHGRSLADELRAEGKMSPIHCAHIAGSVCDALAEAHAAGIVHRDIKPSNVFLDDSHSEQLVKVIDFGIAKLTDTSAEPDLQVSTVAGMFVGSPAYMAPERLLGDPYDGRADVYSVGVMMYEMLSGHLPFEVGDAGYRALVKMQVMEHPPSLTATDVGVPHEMEAIVFDALAKTPDKRPTAQELGARLRDFLIKAPFQPRPS
ncbi:MAG: serine/threonine protein kinase [Anaerolineae bacterium]|nr:serine/threonine protein kinase [Gemmatimonadaceae bacterium]